MSNSSNLPVGGGDLLNASFIDTHTTKSTGYAFAAPGGTQIEVSTMASQSGSVADRRLKYGSVGRPDFYETLYALDDRRPKLYKHYNALESYKLTEKNNRVRIKAKASPLWPMSDSVDHPLLELDEFSGIQKAASDMQAQFDMIAQFESYCNRVEVSKTKASDGSVAAA